MDVGALGHKSRRQDETRIAGATKAKFHATRPVGPPPEKNIVLLYGYCNIPIGKGRTQKKFANDNQSEYSLLPKGQK
jgi:hypothetical protein